MRLFTLLVASAAIFSSELNADIPVVHKYTNIAEDVDGFTKINVVKRNMADSIRKAANHAAAAYNDRTLVALKSRALRHQSGFEERLKLAEEGYQVVSFSASIPGRGNVPAGIVTYKKDPLGKASITVSFHGSESVEDFTEANLRSFKKKNSDLGIQGYMHGGFHDRYLLSREALFDTLEAVLSANEQSIGDVDFMVTGHSLGGALATIAAADMKSKFSKNSLSKSDIPHIDLLTFSSPRVFDHKGAEEMENLLGQQNITRVWRAQDPVPMVSIGSQILGGWFTGFKHVGKSIKLASKTNGVFPSIKNHSIKTIQEDALSPKAVRFDDKHVGYRTWGLNALSRGLGKVRSFFGV